MGRDREGRGQSHFEPPTVLPFMKTTGLTSLAIAASLVSIGCAGPMTSTAVLQDRGQDGGTVRIVCPAYPPDPDTQAKVSAEMAKVCSPRAWMVVDVRIQDADGPTGISCVPGTPCQGKPGPRNQQVDLKFACVAK